MLPATRSTTLGGRPMNTLLLLLLPLVPLPQSITAARDLGLRKVTRVAPCLASRHCLKQRRASPSSRPITVRLHTRRNTTPLLGTPMALTVVACTARRGTRLTSWRPASVPRLLLFRTQLPRMCEPGSSQGLLSTLPPGLSGLFYIPDDLPSRWHHDFQIV
jgi:hypothetical protein